MTEESLPDRDPSKYPDVLYKRAKATESVVKTFFKDNVARARERNQRYGCVSYEQTKLKLTIKFTGLRNSTTFSMTPMYLLRRRRSRGMQCGKLRLSTFDS